MRRGGHDGHCGCWQQLRGSAHPCAGANERRFRSSRARNYRLRPPHIVTARSGGGLTPSPPIVPGQRCLNLARDTSRILLPASQWWTAEATAGLSLKLSDNNADPRPRVRRACVCISACVTMPALRLVPGDAQCRSRRHWVRRASREMHRVSLADGHRDLREQGPRPLHRSREKLRQVHHSNRRGAARPAPSQHPAGPHCRAEWRHCGRELNCASKTSSELPRKASGRLLPGIGGWPPARVCKCSDSIAVVQWGSVWRQRP